MILQGDARHIPLADGTVQCVVTSPPYFGLRSYGAGPFEIGLERSSEEYVAQLVCVFREVRRVCRPDATVWLNLGDSFANKQLVGIPWRVAFALQADGWWLRSDIIWCLSGGTWLYVRSQKGDMPMMLKDAARLDPATVKLWDGKRWARVLGWSRSERKGTELEIVLRSGERIACTPTHRFPTTRGLLRADELMVGDCLQRVQLPEPEAPRDCAIDSDAAWFAGLYIAEGSMAGDTIQIAGHAKQEDRWNTLCAIAARFGGTATRTIDGNKMDIRLYGKVLRAIIDELVTGKTAHDKGFAPVVWRYSNQFIRAMVEGYLSGDGHWDADNQRWRLGFTRNYNLERDLRTACARLGWHLVLNMATVPYNGADVPTFRGELRQERSGHRNEKDTGVIVEIRHSRCRYVYDVGVEGEPHLFALASGILTHNSKPNPMPESVTDRPTKAHEYIFLVTKSARYFWDQEAVREDAALSTKERDAYRGRGNAFYHDGNSDPKGGGFRGKGGLENPRDSYAAGRNIRTVWSIATAPFSGAHFATFPPALAERCIKAGTSERGACPQCGKPWVRVVERTPLAQIAAGRDQEHPKHQERQKMGLRSAKSGLFGSNSHNESTPQSPIVKTLGFRPGCDCDAGEPVPCLVLDPFGGAGTVGLVAQRLFRRCVTLDLKGDYCQMARERIGKEAGMFEAAS